MPAVTADLFLSAGAALVRQCLQKELGDSLEREIRNRADAQCAAAQTR